MHIPTGLIGVPAIVAGAAASTGSLGVIARRGLSDAPNRDIPLAAGGAGIALAAHLMDIPVAGGVTGHALGAALLTVLVGPRLAMIAMATVICLEAVVLHDGGIAEIGVNVVNMAVVAVAVSAAALVLVSRSRLPRAARIPLGAVAAGAASVMAAASALALELAWGAVAWEGDPSGLVAHAGLGDGSSLATLVITHGAVGVAEGLLTGLAVVALVPLLGEKLWVVRSAPRSASVPAERPLVVNAR